MKNLLLTAGFLLTFASLPAAEHNFKACNGKVYEVGDTLRIGKPGVSGMYYYIRKVDENGGMSYIQGSALEEKVIITGVPEYDKNLYEAFAVFDKPATPDIVEARGENSNYYIQLNQAIVNGDIMSDYRKSSVEGVTELTPEILFVYAKKLYGEAVSEKDVEIYAGLKDKEAAEMAKADPFEWEDFKAAMKTELVDRISKAGFDRIFRVKCMSELGQYNLETKVFPLSGFSCSDVTTDQNPYLSKEMYCLWGYCGFHFTNIRTFLNIPSDQNRAKGFYSMRKYANLPSYNTPVAESYVYVKIKEKPVTLPQKDILVNLEWTTLQKEFGKRCLDMEIVRVDSYCCPVMDNETELVYNYLGSQGTDL